MDLDLGPELRAFREEIRAWLAEHRRPELERLDDPAVYWGAPPADERVAAAYRAFEADLRAAGLVCPQWPERYGGRGLSPAQMAVLNEELARARLPRVVRGMGESLVGPSVIAHGTDEQRARLLPRIIAGQDRYCQGFSEPDAGSDLASVQTRGVVDGDEIVVTGQKTWTSRADLATHIFVLCRTDPEAEKHQGLSYVLLPLRDNNITVRPLRQMSGVDGFYQEFFDGARAPLTDIVGGLGNGWRVAMTTLGYERGGATTQYLPYEREFWALVATARERGRLGDPIVRQRLAWAYSQVQVMRFSGLRTMARLAAGERPGPEASVNKLFWSEYHKRLGEIAMDIVGPDAMVRPDGEGYPTSRWQRVFLGSRAGTIYSGTSQIQRRVIGERVLGLPKER